MKIYLLALISVLIFSIAGNLHAATRPNVREALLVPGKKSLYQRVVSHPGAQLLEHGRSDAKIIEADVKPFSVFYVFATSENYTEIGADTYKTLGWIHNKYLTQWPQAMTLMFTDRIAREPVLFFKTLADLTNICDAPDIPEAWRQLRKNFAASLQGQSVDNLPVIASEPEDEEGAVSRQRFYLLPILQVKQVVDETKFVEVASIDPAIPKPKEKETPTPNADSQSISNMSTAVAFVIDTTISMGPYIEQTRNVVKQIFDAVENDEKYRNVHFAIVAFRNSTKAVPELEYTSKVVSDFQSSKNRVPLERALAAVQEAKVSTHSFNEDSLAGIMTAVDKLDWKPHAGRAIILISDAGPLSSNDPYSSTQMGPSQMKLYAAADKKNIKLTVLHIKGSSGKDNHGYAEKAYRALSSQNEASNYIPLPASAADPALAAFAGAAKSLAEGLHNLRVDPPAPEAEQDTRPEEELSPEELARRISQRLGYAMRLDFVGQVNDNQAPSVVKAWISEHDLPMLARDRQVPAVQVAVLMTKNQLNDLHRILQIVLDNAERTKKTQSRDFFEGILTAALQAGRDPKLLQKGDGVTLQKSGVLSEFLEDLPYASDVMNLDEGTWYAKGTGEQQAFIDILKSKIRLYEEFDKNIDNWESFGATYAGDWMYRVPLDALP